MCIHTSTLCITNANKGTSLKNFHFQAILPCRACKLSYELLIPSLLKLIYKFFARLYIFSHHGLQNPLKRNSRKLCEVNKWFFFWGEKTDKAWIWMEVKTDLIWVRLKPADSKWPFQPASFFFTLAMIGSKQEEGILP